MKSIVRYSGVILLTVLVFGCKKESDDKDSPSQEPFTVEVTLPDDTAQTDEVYIIGAFNGGQEYALGNPLWKLTGTALNRSIVLDPATFIGGKTLADGWWFQSPTRGMEVTSDGAAVVRNRELTSVTVEAWEKAAGPSFDPSGTWTVVGTINDWNQKAGIAMDVDGTARIARAVQLKATDEFKFVMDASWDSNFGAGEPNTKFAATVGEEFDLQADGGNITAPAGTYDIYLYPFEAKAKIVTAAEVPPAEKPVSAISVAPTSLDLTVGDTESLTLTITPADAEVKSIDWTSSDSAVATVTPEGVVAAVAAGTATITVTVDGLSATCDVTVAGEEQPGEGPTVYVFNATTWTYVWLYAWAGSGDVEHSWPGQFPDNDIPQVGDYSYYKYTLSEAWSAGEVNLIFNGGEGGGQTADYTITMEGGKSYFFYVNNSKATLIPDPYDFNPADYEEESGYPATLFVYNNNGWESLYIYTWKSGLSPAAWPGTEIVDWEIIYSYKFYKTTLAAEWCSETDDVYFILNDGKGNQTINLAFPIKPGGTYYFNLSGNEAEMIDPANFNPGEPPVQDNAWGIAGTMNNWMNGEDPLPMEVAGDYYVAKGVTLEAGTEFKFVQNKSWTVNRGGTFVSLGEAFALYQDGANIKPGLSGTYDIYIKSDGSSAYIPAP